MIACSAMHWSHFLYFNPKFSTLNFNFQTRPVQRGVEWKHDLFTCSALNPVRTQMRAVMTRERSKQPDMSESNNSSLFWFPLSSFWSSSWDQQCCPSLSQFQGKYIRGVIQCNSMCDLIVQSRSNCTSWPLTFPFFTSPTAFDDDHSQLSFL